MQKTNVQVTAEIQAQQLIETHLRQFNASAVACNVSYKCTHHVMLATLHKPCNVDYTAQTMQYWLQTASTDAAAVLGKVTLLIRFRSSTAENCKQTHSSRLYQQSPILLQAGSVRTGVVSVTG